MRKFTIRYSKALRKVSGSKMKNFKVESFRSKRNVEAANFIKLARLKKKDRSTK